MDKQGDWSPFQKYPTNMLQLYMDHVEILTKGGLAADISVLFQKHKELLKTDVGMDQMFATFGMAGNSTILRFVNPCFV